MDGEVASDKEARPEEPIGPSEALPPETEPEHEPGNEPGTEALDNDPPVLLSKFTVYESKQSFFIVGSNSRENLFRVLELQLLEDDDFAVKEHEGVLSRSEVNALLTKLETEGDGVKKRITAWGILGCIRFTGPYYLCLITKCCVVALLGGHYILHVDETRMIPLVPSGAHKLPNRRSAEARLAGVFHNLDLSKTFYFSPSFDLTNTLQINLGCERMHLRTSRQQMFVWNSHLLAPLLERFDGTMEWCQALMHGFIDQAKISIFGNAVYVTLIARRSHHFAGARFYKRGTNNQGYVANEVETEQIVSNQLTSSFHDGRAGPFDSPRYTSYVQHRGSIPLSWSQLAQNISPKPPIRIDSEDPYYTAAAQHFDRLFERYGTPLRVLNLVKIREKVPRESLLGREFEHCIEYLNQFLPKDKHIHYTAWDMSRAAKKGRSSEVIDYLEKYAAETVAATSIFHNGPGGTNQEGVCRTNCIDCLDRTNAAQSVIGKYALGYQLHAMGILDKPHVDYDTDVADLLTEMYHDHGDTLALQYGGSNLVNTVETYRRINQWSSHSRDLVESVRRFYTNSFVDAQRQDAINVFLGNYQYHGDGAAHLWDLATDYYLHNDSNGAAGAPRRSYRKWFSPVHLGDFKQRLISHTKLMTAAAVTSSSAVTLLPSYQLQLEHHWSRLYRPRVFTTLEALFSYKMNSTDRYSKSNFREPKSPFEKHADKSQKRSTRRHPRPPPLPVVSTPISEEPPILPNYNQEAPPSGTVRDLLEGEKQISSLNNSLVLSYEKYKDAPEPRPSTQIYEDYFASNLDPAPQASYKLPEPEWVTSPTFVSVGPYERYFAQ